MRVIITMGSVYRVMIDIGVRHVINYVAMDVLVNVPCLTDIAKRVVEAFGETNVTNGAVVIVH